MLRGAIDPTVQPTRKKKKSGPHAQLRGQKPNVSQGKSLGGRVIRGGSRTAGSLAPPWETARYILGEVVPRTHINTIHR